MTRDILRNQVPQMTNSGLPDPVDTPEALFELVGVPRQVPGVIPAKFRDVQTQNFLGKMPEVILDEEPTR
ncbi:hypothetical protein [Pseudophaeobacter sp.]|uniref:hypothetical protein n=1 Tax=Pseudophaeobacter sp. TaxID=1971739 RepID=UPI003297AB09